MLAVDAVLFGAGSDDERVARGGAPRHWRCPREIATDVETQPEQERGTEVLFPGRGQYCSGDYAPNRGYTPTVSIEATPDRSDQRPHLIGATKDHT
jgi:hypothetical protein